MLRINHSLNNSQKEGKSSWKKWCSCLKENIPELNGFPFRFPQRPDCYILVSTLVLHAEDRCPIFVSVNQKLLRSLQGILPHRTIPSATLIRIMLSLQVHRSLIINQFWIFSISAFKVVTACFHHIHWYWEATHSSNWV